MWAAYEGGLSLYLGVCMAEYEAYCVKCREKTKFEGEIVTFKNGRKAAQGKCPKCGTKVTRILGKADA